MSGQRWEPGQYRRDAGFVAAYGREVLALLQPRPGERILDLGCGDGTLTRELAARGAEVVAVDSSPGMVAAARALGLDAGVADGEQLPFSAEFDAVFSNAALHWMRRPAAVLDGVRRALRPGGRFVGEFGGAGNVAQVSAAMRAVFAAHPEFGPFEFPWYFPTPEAYAGELARAGFRVASIELLERPTPLPGELAAWLAVFADGITRRLDPEQKRTFIAEVSARCRAALWRQPGGWSVDYVRLRFSAVLDG
ncbi:MAG TPA: methyltransferase domain-containing protein [Gammaproteobacteria bacterium]